MSNEDRLGVANKLMSSGIFPPEGAKVLGWWGTADGWGILLVDAEDEKAAIRCLESWRAAGTGFFKTTKSAPAMAIQELIPAGQELLEKLAST